MNDIERQRLSMSGTPSWPLTPLMQEFCARPAAHEIARIMLDTWDGGFWRETLLIPRWVQITARRPLIDNLVLLGVLRRRMNKSGTGHYYVPTPYTRPWCHHAIHLYDETRNTDVPHAE